MSFRLQMDAKPALNRLHHLGLIEALSDGNLRLHRLLRLYVQGQEADLRAIKRRWKRH